jgi:hypothetical protein
MKVTVVVVSFPLALTFVSSPATAQFPGGAIYQAQGAPVPELFMLTVSGQTFVATILTFGPSETTVAGSPRSAAQTEYGGRGCSSFPRR